MCEFAHRAQSHHTVPVCTMRAPPSMSETSAVDHSFSSLQREAKSSENQLEPVAHYVGNI